jgi:hypothetical protein
VSELGGDFGEGDQDEVALEHPGMGNLESGLVDDEIVVQKDVEINEARAFGDRFVVAHVRFNAAKGGEQLGRREIGLRFERGVKEPRLVEVIDGFSFVEGRKFDDCDGGVFKELQSAAKIGFAVAEIGAEGEIDGGHERFSPRNGWRASV